MLHVNVFQCFFATSDKSLLNIIPRFLRFGALVLLDLPRMQNQLATSVKRVSHCKKQAGKGCTVA